MNFITKSYLHLICPIIVLTVGLTSIMSGRNVVSAGSDPSLDWATTTTALNVFILQIISFSIVLICTFRILYVFKSMTYHDNGTKLILYAYLFYFTANVVLNGVLGTKPFINHHGIYSLLVTYAIFIETDCSITKYIQATKIAILLLLFFSVLTALVLPQIAVQENYNGIIPSISFRLWGLGSHPNSIGAISLFFLLLITHEQFEIRLVQFFAVVIASIVLILSQSKTVFIALITCFGIMLYYRMKLRIGFKTKQLIVSLIIFAVAITLILSIIIDIEALSTKLLSLIQSDDTFSLTGRDRIWDVAILEWKNNPLFGYGPTMWDEEFRNLIGMNYAFSAHNQFLQSLACAGIFGFMSLIIYLLVLFIFSIRVADATKGLSLAIFVLFALRSITETPLSLGTIISGEFMMQAQFILILIFSYRCVDATLLDNTQILKGKEA